MKKRKDDKERINPDMKRSGRWMGWKGEEEYWEKRER